MDSQTQAFYQSTQWVVWGAFLAGVVWGLIYLAWKWPEAKKAGSLGSHMATALVGMPLGFLFAGLAFYYWGPLGWVAGGALVVVLVVGAIHSEVTRPGQHERTRGGAAAVVAAPVEDDFLAYYECPEWARMAAMTEWKEVDGVYPCVVRLTEVGVFVKPFRRFRLHSKWAHLDRIDVFQRGEPGNETVHVSFKQYPKYGGINDTTFRVLSGESVERVEARMAKYRQYLHPDAAEHQRVNALTNVEKKRS